MTLARTADLVRAARAAGTGIGAFNVVHLETAEALVAASELARLPVILQISQNCAEYHGGLGPIGIASLALASAVATPVSVHLDHAENVDLVSEAIDLGFSSVMFDGGALPYRENVALTARVVERARAAGVYVEGELGEVGGKDGAHAPGVRTDPVEARSFVTETGVDALAVAVGSSHAMTERTAALDLALIMRLREALDVPLVLHGSSGVADEQLVGAVRAGMTKVNVSTHLNGVFTRAIRASLDANPQVVDSRRYVRDGRTAIVSEAARMLGMLEGLPVPAAGARDLPRLSSTC